MLTYDFLRFDPHMIVKEVGQITTPEAGIWWRLLFNPQMVQQPSRIVDAGKAWPLQGLHGTTLPGTILIAKERRLRALNFKGVYALLALNPKTIEEMLSASCHRVLTGSKNQSGIVWELAVKAEFRTHSSGGVDADNDTCAAGLVSHMKTSSENRWCTPGDLIQLRALWVSNGSLEGLSHTHENITL